MKKRMKIKVKKVRIKKKGWGSDLCKGCIFHSQRILNFCVVYDKARCMKHKKNKTNMYIWRLDE